MQALIRLQIFRRTAFNSNMNAATAMEGIHNHLAQAFMQLETAIDRCGGKPPTELLELAKHLTCAQALMTDLSRAARSYMVAPPTPERRAASES